MLGQVLDMSNCHLSEETLIRLAKSLEMASKLRILILSRNKFGANVTKALGKMLLMTAALERLELSENDIGSSLGYLSVC